MSNSSGACRVCLRTWPRATFKKFAELAAGRDVDGIDPLCDSHWDRPITAEGQIAEKIDEAQTVAGESVLIRQVIVTGVESKTNVIGFRYPTHIRHEALVITDLLVTFKNDHDYLYKSVPIAVCEAWYAAPSQGLSLGEYFIQFVKTSYECQKVK